jgi:hypothetical protein
MNGLMYYMCLRILTNKEEYIPWQEAAASLVVRSVEPVATQEVKTRGALSYKHILES